MQTHTVVKDCASLPTPSYHKFISFKYTNTQMLLYIVRATHTHYALRYSLSSESELILVTRVHTPSHTNTCTHYSLLEDIRSDHSMTGSERTSRVTESPTYFIPVQLLQQSICAACRIKPWIWIGLHFPPNSKEDRIFRGRTMPDYFRLFISWEMSSQLIYNA